MERVESKILPPSQIDLAEALEGLVSLGKITLALALIGVITHFGLKKITSGGKK